MNSTPEDIKNKAQDLLREMPFEWTQESFLRIVCQAIQQERGRRLPDDMNVTCPFCQDTGYDLAGLKGHLARGWCESYSAVEVPTR